MTAKKKKDISENEVPPEILPKVIFPRFYEENGNSSKYNWNEEFVIKVGERIFQWFVSNNNLYHWSTFARENLGMFFDEFVKRMSEYPFIWNKLHKELKLITDERIEATLLSTKNAYGLTKALKFMGSKTWDDQTTININTKSIADQIGEAYDSLEVENKPLKKEREFTFQLIPPKLEEIDFFK